MTNVFTIWHRAVYTRTICLLTLIVFTSNAHAQNITASPDMSYPGQTLTTTITSNNYFFAGASQQAPEIFLSNPNNPYTINAYNVTVSPDSSSADATFDIPANAMIGWYTVVANNLDSDGYVISTAIGNFRVGDFNINGTVYNDLNGNGVKNAGEGGLANQQVLILPDSNYITTDANGKYQYTGQPSSSHTVKWVIDSNYYQTSSPIVYNYTVNNYYDNKDFGIHISDTTLSINTSIWFYAATCNQQRNAITSVSNWGSVTANGSVVFIKPSNALYISSTPVAASVTGDTIKWNYTILLPGATQLFTAKLQMPAAGQELTHYATAYAQNATFGLYDTATAYLFETTTCSYDPNLKAANSDVISSDTIPIDYTIQFQNTGTDTAYQVIVRDTLSNLLDWSSFQLLGSSNPVIVIQSLNGELEFVFTAINLVDSNTNEPGSHGSVTFRVFADTSIVSGDTIHNTASIYFDLNAPVLTNDAVVRFCVPVTTNQSFILCNGDSVQVANNWYSQTGTYTDSMLTSDGCDSIIVTQVTASSVAVSITSTNTTCGFNNGSATVVPTGDAAPFTVLWSNGSTSTSINNLAPLLHAKVKGDVPVFTVVVADPLFKPQDVD